MILFLVLVILSIYDGLIVDARRDSRQSLSLVRPTKAPKEDLPSIFPCNGDIRYCHLRYDQYTFAGSHNSGAYNLSFDCSTALGMTKFLCYRGIPNPLMNCLWNNMGDRNLLRQLRDGLRALDLDTCQVEDRAVLCHGEEKIRALGEELPDAFSQIRQFLEENPFEVITIEFGDNDGDPRVNAPYIASQLQEHLGDYLYHRMDSNDWPTLGELIQTGKRVIVFMADNQYGLDHAVPWILQRSDHYYGSWVYTHASMTIPLLQETFMNYCTWGPDIYHSRQWQCLDFE